VFSSRSRHTICLSDWSSDVCSSDLFSTAAPSPDPRVGLRAAVEKGRWDGAHAATDNATIANNTPDFIEGSLKGHRASGSCGRSRSEERRVGKERRTRWKTTRGKKEE